MSQFWEEDRKKPRGSYVIPCLLRDTETQVYLKAVIIDISAKGCRVFTNDQHVGVMSDERLRDKTFQVEFDFYDVKTEGIIGKIVNIHPGENPQYERQFGIEFTAVDAITARDINRIVKRDNL